MAIVVKNVPSAQLLKERYYDEIAKLQQQKTVIDLYISKLEDEKERFDGKGTDAEIAVANRLNKLSDDFIVIHGLKFYDPATSYFQMDHIVISKTSLFCIETKNLSSDLEYVTSKNCLRYKLSGHHIPDPREQASKNAAFVDSVLRKNNLSINVISVVILVDTSLQISQFPKIKKSIILSSADKFCEIIEHDNPDLKKYFFLDRKNIADFLVSCSFE